MVKVNCAACNHGNSETEEGQSPPLPEVPKRGKEGKQNTLMMAIKAVQSDLASIKSSMKDSRKPAGETGEHLGNKEGKRRQRQPAPHVNQRGEKTVNTVIFVVPVIIMPEDVENGCR